MQRAGINQAFALRRVPTRHGRIGNSSCRGDLMKSFTSIKRPVRLTLASSALALSLSLGVANAQESVSAADAENGNLWFVELSGAPVADGGNLASVRNEKAAFRAAAKAAAVAYKERMSYDTLFNGFSIEVAPGDRAKVSQLAGVKAMYPVELIHAPTPEQAAGSAADLASAITMTGASVAQNSLGLSGKDIKVGIVDTGIDIDHPAFGGGGVPGGTPFPSARVTLGYDFVGDNYNAGGTPAQQVPVPDDNPDDCGGHGTHVAGIVGANGGGLKGVAPGVTFGAYRVFGCTGSSSSDVIVAALERAYADGMQVINQSLGAARQWPQYPTAQASTRLVNKGVVMVASIGNNGPGGSSPDALFAAGAPGTGAKVIGVASFDNLQSTQTAFRVDPGATLVGFNAATGAPPPPTSGTQSINLPGGSVFGCNAADFAGFPAGTVALISRGTCTFYAKAINAMNAGASAVVLYNNAAGALNPTVAGTPPVTIPVVAITQSAGQAIASQPGATLTWGPFTVTSAVSTGGLISGFSSFGLAADLSLKPQIGAPGGLIYSSYPIELGSYATLSGTSMSAPHVAGGVALILEANPRIPAQAMQARIQNTADPKNWSLNPGLGLLDHVHRQGAGMLDIMGTINATTVVEPSQLSLGESEFGPKTFTINVKNGGSNAVTYDLSHIAGIATGPNTQSGSSYAITGFFSAPASVTFSSPNVWVPAGGSATFNVTIAANATLADRSIYGGYVTLTPQGGGETLRVPFAGFKGDYQTTQVLTPTALGFPWLAQLVGTSYLNRNATGATYTMANGDIPYFLMHLDHLSRRIRLEASDAVTGRSWFRVSDDQYVTRNSTPGGFFTFTWDGTTSTGKGKNDSQWRTVPNGQYVVKVSVLKALGDESNPAHWETWTSNVITIARP
jgi:subtilisin family serine protease